MSLLYVSAAIGVGSLIAGAAVAAGTTAAITHIVRARRNRP